jgi:DNA-binding response OmpR family regulator
MTTILIIDDDDAMRQMMREILAAAQYQIVEAPDGVIALQKFREHRPQLVITDILMPNKDGIETVREIRKIDPTAVILAVSGGGRAKYVNFLEVAREFGAAEVMQKPFRREALLATVQKLLAKP